MEQIYRYDRTRWRVAWLLLYLSEEYNRSASGKWLFLEKQYQYGCTSPVIYLEALALLNSNPALLRKLNGFELQVLHFGARQEAISDSLLASVSVWQSAGIFAAFVQNSEKSIWEKRRCTYPAGNLQSVDQRRQDRYGCFWLV